MEHFQASRTVFFSHDHYIYQSYCLFSKSFKSKRNSKANNTPALKQRDLKTLYVELKMDRICK